MKWDRLPYPRLRSEEGERYCLWPIRLGLVPRKGSVNCPWWRRFYAFTWHGWQTHTEQVPVEKTSKGSMPGFRRVFGQTLHLGFLQIRLGRREPGLEAHPRPAFTIVGLSSSRTQRRHKP